MTAVGAAFSEHPRASHALGETVGHLLEVGGREPDLLVLLTTGAHASLLHDLAAALRHLLDPRTMIGATAHEVLESRRGVADRPALGLFALWFGAPAIRAVRIDDDLGGLARASDGTLLVLSDPFSFRVARFVAGLPLHEARLSTVGASASAARRPGGNRLLIGPDIHDDGAVALHIDAAVGVRAVAALGQRPVGAPFTVTGAEGSRIVELAGRPAVERMHETLAGLHPTDAHLTGAERSRPDPVRLTLGRVLDEQSEHHGPGDFRIHELEGSDPETGAVVVTGGIPVGATVQFHLDDPSVRTEELARRLDGVAPLGCLFFDDVDRRAPIVDPGSVPAAVVDVVGSTTVLGMGGAGTFGPTGSCAGDPEATLSLLVVEAATRRSTGVGGSLRSP